MNAAIGWLIPLEHYRERQHKVRVHIDEHVRANHRPIAPSFARQLLVPALGARGIKCAQRRRYSRRGGGRHVADRVVRLDQGHGYITKGDQE
jgi:hypothetical protein